MESITRSEADVKAIKLVIPQKGARDSERSEE